MSQPLASMTGYARATGAAGTVAFSCEMKSVNGRGLDMRMRLAPGLDPIEGEIRRRIGAAVTRGSLTVTINVDREGATGEVVVNQQALKAVLTAMDDLSRRLDARRPSLDGILGLKGVLDQKEKSLPPEEEEALQAAILDCVERCLVGLVDARRREGVQLSAVLGRHIDEIERLTRKAEAHPSRDRAMVLERLRSQVAELVANGAGVSEERMAQEALLLATRADIREELDRLVAHIANARQLLSAGGPVGRKLDFLSQEFNREANTLCSKSNAVDLTSIGLDLKAAIDQLREQVQNIE
ncbi:YicC/YloC family endoribonuclease [Paradevosia shaoguanensis]|uniref:YicC/YloC family endoribonuclease n=1 Tax=Paradevosia shaoguanensis TaxID=1335043 RepID=UPI003C7416C2